MNVKALGLMALFVFCCATVVVADETNPPENAVETTITAKNRNIYDSDVKAQTGEIGINRSELRAALKQAKAHDGLSVVHVPVYAGPYELAGLGAWGQWNVGNWCEDVQRAWIEQDL